jgi:hypothetical protein
MIAVRTLIVVHPRFRLASAQLKIAGPISAKRMRVRNLSAVFSLKTKEHIMTLTIEQREAVAVELKKLAGTLNLTDDQKVKLSNFMSEAREKVEEYKQQNPNATKDDVINRIVSNRSALRERLVNFLTPEQLSKWDAGVADMKEFWGQKAA